MYARSFRRDLIQYLLNCKGNFVTLANLADAFHDHPQSKKYDDRMVQEAQVVSPGPEKSKRIETVAANFGVDRATVYRHLQKYEANRKNILNRMAYLIRQGAVVVVRRHARLTSLGDSGPKPQEILYAISRPKLKALLRKPIRRPYSGWDKMWRVIRASRRFTRNDLCQLAGVTRANANQFTKGLRRAGYLREVRGIWQIVRDPGPNRPIPQAK